MTTVEKLFVQIFERKNSIIQQIKQHTDFYNQHLASKCLIEGITPPPWLWNPNFHFQSSDIKELKKEELISELLLPQPQTTILYSSGQSSLSNKPVVTRNNGQLSDLLFGETHVSGKVYDAEDHPTHVPEVCDNEVECGVNRVPELDSSINSPQDQTEIRISNIYTATDQSLARIQRSRSRQQALELRNSAKAVAKSRLCHENNPDASSSESSLSKNASKDCGNELLKLVKPFYIGDENSVLKEAKEGACQSKENDKSICCSKIRRSRSSLKQPSCTSGSLELDGANDFSKEDDGMAESEDKLLQLLNHVDGKFKVVKSSDITAESCGVRGEIGDGQIHKETGSNIYSGRITRSWSSRQQPNSVNVSSKLHASTFTVKADCDNLKQSIDKSKQELGDATKLLESIERAVVLFAGRDARSEVTCSNKGISKPINNSSDARCGITQAKIVATEASLGENPFIQSERCEFQHGSDGQGILPCHDTHVISQEGNAETTGAIHLVSNGPVKPLSVCLGSNLDCDNLRWSSEGFIAGTSSDCCMFMEPKQLNFDELEECNLNKAHSPTLDGRVPDKSSEKICGTLLKGSPRKLISETPNRSPLEIHSSAGREVSRKAEEGCRVSIEADMEECHLELELMKLGSSINENNLSRNIEDILKTVLHRENSLASDEAVFALSDAFKGTCGEINEVTFDIPENHEPSVELQVEEGYEVSGGSPTISNTTKGKQLGLSHAASLTKQASQDIQDALIRELRMADSYAGERRQGCEQDDQGLSCVKNKFCCKNLDTLAYTEETLEETTYLGEDGLMTNVSAGSSHCEDQNGGFLKSKELQLLRESALFERRFSITKMCSWPEFKRRKFDDQLGNCFSTFPSFRLQNLHSFKENHTGTYLEFVRHNSDTVISLQDDSVSHEGNLSGANVNKIPGVGPYQNMTCHLTEEIGTSCKLSVREARVMFPDQGELGSELTDMTAETFSSFNERSGASDLSSLTKKETRDSEYCSFKETGIANASNSIVDVRKSCDEQDYQQILQLDSKLNMVNSNDVPYAEKTLWDQTSHLGEDNLLSNCSVLSPPNNGLDLIGPDQAMPVFEGFIIDPQTENGEPGITANGINLGNVDISSTTIERASILEQICKSASMHTPFAHLSSAFKLHRTQDLHQSVPNGLLEHMDLRGTLDHTVIEQPRPSCSHLDEGSRVLPWRTYSDRLPCSGTRYGWNSRSLFTSPVGKLWERVSLNSGSSEKQSSSNPELTCFPIEEDPSMSEENENADEVTHKIPEDIDAVATNNYARREPLADITEACSNPPTSVSAVEKFPDRGSVDSTNRKVSFAVAHSRVKRKLASRHSNKTKCKNEGSENWALSIGASGGKKANELLHNRSSKPKLSRKTSLRKGVPRVSEKEYKRNNIVSNITSFIPLVQQKQAAAVCTGKRDVKVKALEAAEAAKRLEEKRENQRKLRKEALKLERERQEQENLKQMELHRKMKEEERKKKDADVAARKRMREEEEKKEKEKKRKRVEARQQQREQEEKLRAVKMEKEKQCGIMDEKMICGKESNKESKKRERMEKERGDVDTLKKPETERGGVVLTSDVQHVNTATNDSDANGKKEEISTLNISLQIDDLATKTSLEKSYEISPYQCSDDEEEEEDNLPARKFIPSWASKNFVSMVLSSQQKLDPDMIFPQESFCSMDEVLLPRKLQKK